MQQFTMILWGWYLLPHGLGMVAACDVERDWTLPIPMLLNQSTAQRRHEHMELGIAKQNKTPIQIYK